MTTSTYTWPKHASNGKPKSIGDMSAKERIQAEGTIHQDMRKMSLTTIIVKAFLERQTAIAHENIALGKDIG